MPIDLDPIVDTWYRHTDKGYRFRVIAVDDDTGTVELQHFDGDTEALSLDEWYDLDIEVTEPPEDWTGPVDDIERDDLGYTETDMTDEDWTKPLEENPDSGSERLDRRPPPETEDDWGEGVTEEEPWEGEDKYSR